MSRSPKGSTLTSNRGGGSAGLNTTTLLDRIHKLLSKLNDTTDIIKRWPEPGENDDATKVHYDATTELMESIHEIIHSLRNVEDKVIDDNARQRENNNDNGSNGGSSTAGMTTNDATTRRQVLDALVPLDLLDLMDYGNGLNPECFVKQLIREALRHLSELRRRKVALEMLGKAIEAGMKKKEEEEREAREKEKEEKSKKSKEEEKKDGEGGVEEEQVVVISKKKKKRPRDDGGTSGADGGDVEGDEEPAKKKKL